MVGEFQNIARLTQTVCSPSHLAFRFTTRLTLTQATVLEASQIFAGNPPDILIPQIIRHSFDIIIRASIFGIRSAFQLLNAAILSTFQDAVFGFG